MSLNSSSPANSYASSPPLLTFAPEAFALIIRVKIDKDTLVFIVFIFNYNNVTLTYFKERVNLSPVLLTLNYSVAWALMVSVEPELPGKVSISIIRVR